MHTAQPIDHATNSDGAFQAGVSQAEAFQVIRRNGERTPFNPDKIQHALTKAFLAVEGQQASGSRRIHETVNRLTQGVVTALNRRLHSGALIHIEDIQDQVELALMRDGHHKTARAYVLYREQQAQQRRAETTTNGHEAPHALTTVNITDASGNTRPLPIAQLQQAIDSACQGLHDVEAERLLQDTLHNLYEGIAIDDVHTALTLSARSLIEHDPNYRFVAARLLLNTLKREVIHQLNLPHLHPTPTDLSLQLSTDGYRELFIDAIHYAIQHELLDPELAQFDLQQLAQALQPQRDGQFSYLGLQTLYDRYFLHHRQHRLELPQVFFMRVAMGLAMGEREREQRAIEFYHLLSSFDFMSSTPTLFNSGTLRPQLSSCYLTTVADDLDSIYSAIKDNALLSKFAGGLGNDWTRVRGLGATIKGTHGQSQGVVPFLKVANDTAVAVNQGGKRKGAVCAYLEVWHVDIEDFLDLRKNTGDERRRTHDMNTACWIPDLFMQRVQENGEWTLFSPDEVPDLHELTGNAFKLAYEAHEDRARRGDISVFRTIPAVQLWRRILSQLFETGHPWITFKDPCNLRYTNQHVGVVHSSNLCTEITLHTNDKEIAVCNLGSVNLAAHTDSDGLDLNKLKRTVTTAMRMLDNVIDDNYYSVPQARNANLRHRPVGLGLMGFQDALYKLNLPYASEEAVAFADRTMEAISYYAIQASSQLAAERGRYPSYTGSLWSQGILPLDSIECLRATRGDQLDVNTDSTLDWDTLRQQVQTHGMRNSNCLAIAPTATISNICGVSQSIEPTYQNLYVKSNLSGEFTVINPMLVDELKALNLWDDVMVNDLKYFDGTITAIDRIPDSLKKKYACAFEIDSSWLIEAAARRQKWLDQSQSLNLYLAEPSGKQLDHLYQLAWRRGLKTTYYLRTLGATHMEKATVTQENTEPQSNKGHNDGSYDNNTRNAHIPPETSTDSSRAVSAMQTCDILDPHCEACQ